MAALTHNARVLHQGASTPLIAVVKADAYGHGALEVARALTQLPFVKMLAVASVDEAKVLREAKIDTPILLLSGILPEECEAAISLDLTPTLSTLEVARALNDAAQRQNKTARAHWKINSGMNRLGTPHPIAPQFWNGLKEYSRLKVEGVYTHFCCADEDDEEITTQQISRFENALRECGIPRTEYSIHAANSAAALRFSQARFDLIRPGIALYGANPLRENIQNKNENLQPVMNLKARIVEIREVRKGQSVSYGAMWSASRDSQIALVPLGYADGYLRALSNIGEVLVRGKKCGVVGRVTMDQILIDVTEITPNAQAGEIVTAWGRDELGNVLRVEEVAQKAGTISYELLCRVASRVPRVYLNDSTP